MTIISQISAAVESCLRETAAQFSVRFGVIIRSIDDLRDDSHAVETEIDHGATQDKALRSIKKSNILFVDTTSRIGALEVQVRCSSICFKKLRLVQAVLYASFTNCFVILVSKLFLRYLFLFRR